MSVPKGEAVSRDLAAIASVAPPLTVLLGKYQLEELLGTGGMGAVYAAKHLQLDDRVAVKLLLDSAAKRPEIVRRFVREGRATIKIRSEHCVRVLDVGSLPDGRPYMVMEYLEGRDLEKMICDGPLPIADSVDYVLQASEALAEAHSLGMVHRDLKPANLFLTRRADGSPCIKVLDFGISKLPAADSGDRTSATEILGSPLYMSPEQMRSARDVDSRSDIWALGAVLYEMLTGVPPFDGPTTNAICARILEERPKPIAELRPDVPSGLVAAIGTTMRKRREKRFETLARFAEAIAPFGTARAQASSERIARVLAGGVKPPEYSESSLPAVTAEEVKAAKAEQARQIARAKAKAKAKAEAKAQAAQLDGASTTERSSMREPKSLMRSPILVGAGVGTVLAGLVLILSFVVFRPKPNNALGKPTASVGFVAPVPTTAAVPATTGSAPTAPATESIEAPPPRDPIKRAPGALSQAVPSTTAPAPTTSAPVTSAAPLPRTPTSPFDDRKE